MQLRCEGLRPGVSVQIQLPDLQSADGSEVLSDPDGGTSREIELVVPRRSSEDGVPAGAVVRARAVSSFGLREGAI